MENSRKRRAVVMSGADDPSAIQSDERDGIVCIHNRKVNISALVSSDASLYVLLRSWIQDDPDRQQTNGPTTQAAPGENVVPSLYQPLSSAHSQLLQDCIDKVSVELHCDSQRCSIDAKSEATEGGGTCVKEEGSNSPTPAMEVEEVKAEKDNPEKEKHKECDEAGSDQAQLCMHLANWKLVRSRWHALTTAKYALVKSALFQKGVNCEEYVNIKQHQYYRRVNNAPAVQRQTA